MNDKNGWIKLHRNLIDSAVFNNEKTLKVWIWCLLKASHKRHEVLVGNQVVRLEAGQFVYGGTKAAECLNLSESMVRRSISSLEQLGMIHKRSTTKYSVITILKWNEYQIGDNRGSKQYGLGYHNGKKDAEKEMEGLKSEIPSEKIMITIKEASEYSGLSYNAIRQMCLQDKIPYIRAGNKYLINKEKLIEYLKNGDK